MPRLWRVDDGFLKQAGEVVRQVVGFVGIINPLSILDICFQSFFNHLPGGLTHIVKPDSQTFQLTEGQTASIQFENKLKRWRVTVTKADNKTGSTPRGNGSLAGAKYGVYKGNELVKEYTTDEKGQFTTDYFPYGEDWTLREISAGEGYLVSDVSTQLCEIPAGSNNEFNDNTASVTETIMRGGVSVEKRDSKTGERPQGDADFSGIQFEVVNKSKNLVEVGGKKAAPGEVAITITTNAQGVATTGPNVLP